MSVQRQKVLTLVAAMLLTVAVCLASGQVQQLIRKGEAFLSREHISGARSMLAQAQSIDPQHPDVMAFAERLSAFVQERSEKHILSGRF